MGIKDNLQQRLDAYVAGNCSPSALSEELTALCTAAPRATWEILALLDQYHRRGKLPQALHRSISQNLERRALGVQAAANQPVMEPPAPPAAPVARLAAVAEVAAPAGEVRLLRKQLQAPRPPPVRYAWRRWWWRAVPSASMALLLLAISASQSVGERGPALPAPPVLRSMPPPVAVPVQVATPGRLSLASDWIIVQPGAHEAAITVTRSGGTDAAISFLWWTQSAGARAGSDFRAHRARRVSMPAGAQALKLSVPILDNPARQHTELFYVAIGRPRGGATLGDTRRAAVFILRR